MCPQDPLRPEFIVAAYRGGYFPMPDSESNEILWYNPDPRTIIPLESFHISKSLRRAAKAHSLVIDFDTDFRGVVEGCAARETTWISEDVKNAYIRLFELGIAHSVEVKDERGLLVGGLYGLSQGGVFNAESMFSRVTNASKLALWALVTQMRSCGLSLLEVQFMTEHLKSLGALEIPKEVYLRHLAHALEDKVRFIGRRLSTVQL
jgi:leucyl/phenylalanyl-tRNA---protein transferase